MNLISQLKDLGTAGRKGYRVGSQVQASMAGMGGTQGGRAPGYYGQSVLSPLFKKNLATEGITARETPMQFLGAYTSRIIVDAANDGTRTYWWRYNHPLAIAQRVSDLVLDKAGMPQSPVTRSLIGLGIGLPSIAAAGTYDITNPEQQFRPKGYSQAYAEEGAEDRRESTQPAQELFERFFLGRTGRPLKYETAKQDIPDLTPERYGNYLNHLYNDKGFLNLGIVKGTTENLQGVPEARLLGFPASIPMVGGFAAGTAGAIIGAKTAPGITKIAGRSIMGGAIGSAVGVAMGQVVNETIAAANRPQLSRLSDYQQQDNI